MEKTKTFLQFRAVSEYRPVSGPWPLQNSPIRSFVLLPSTIHLLHAHIRPRHGHSFFEAEYKLAGVQYARLYVFLIR